MLNLRGARCRRRVRAARKREDQPHDSVASSGRATTTTVTPPAGRPSWPLAHRPAGSKIPTCTGLGNLDRAAPDNPRTQAAPHTTREETRDRMNIDEIRHRKSAQIGAPLWVYENMDEWVAPVIRADPAALTRPPIVPTPAAAVRLFWGCFQAVSTIDHFEEMDVWLRYLEVVGFAGLDNAIQPDVPTVLYRAAPASRREGLSWTPSYVVAESSTRTVWADRQIPSPVWTAVVDPWRVLAVDNEFPEWLIDPRGLTIRRMPPIAVS